MYCMYQCIHALNQFGYVKKRDLWIHKMDKEIHLMQEPRWHQKLRFAKKSLCSQVLWDYKRILYLELLQRSQKIISNMYIQQLAKLRKVARIGNS